MSVDVTAVFRERFGRAPRGVATAPGRVNLIGEHTDYNDGFVCPVAIDRHVRVAFGPSGAGELSGYAVDYDELRTAAIAELAPERRTGGWLDYVAGAVWTLRREGHDAPGMELVVTGDVPKGAGLSSSAALELACLRALYELGGIPWSPREAALLGQSVENDYIGLRSGVMDQMASALAVEGTAMLLDCRDLSVRTVPLPEDLVVVVLDTGTRREVAESAYNDRRESCERVVAVIAKLDPEVEALRDASLEHLQGASARLSDVDLRRATHVVLENERVLAFAKELEAEDGDRDEIAALMYESHRSLRDLYEVSCAELDAVVDACRGHAACHGARMTGAGFGGAAVGLVEPDGVTSLAREVERAVPGATTYECRAVSGASLSRS